MDCNKALAIFPNDKYILQIKDEVVQKRQAEVEARSRQAQAESEAKAKQQEAADFQVTAMQAQKDAEPTIRQQSVELLENLIDAARSAADVGVWSEARSACERALKIDPTNVDIKQVLQKLPPKSVRDGSF